MRLAIALAPAALFLLAACGDDPAPDTRPRGPLPRSENLDGSFRARLLYYQGPACGSAGASVAATGPGPDLATTTVPLACSSGTWSAQIVFAAAAHPDTAADYTFAVTEGGATRNEIGRIPCYIETLPAPLDPSGGTTTSPVTFAWTLPGALPGTAMEYTVYVFGPNPAVRSSVVDRGSLTLALPARQYESWAVDVTGVGGWEPTSPVRCSGRNTSGPTFTVLP